MLIFIVLGLIPLGFFCFGLALFVDFRGVATHYTARNRAVVEEMARNGQDARSLLVLGDNRKMGPLIMLLSAGAVAFIVYQIVTIAQNGG
ncbi:hypothetical protein [Kitasatospora phosalacinea]|uniref:Uncharacterized protein n=1 Tax=Kitasatospora phosalacinea TaxID=2065 RepID=A0A9W6PJ02_9ACTN|nr:hypothetical protein [Kitasatospora phosalacinea]GLW55971.1 hypothetical protein Kpho01_39820 [Kitasatospora phosalacinea]